MSEQSYNPTELLICTASRLMTDNTTAFIGTGIPMLAASLAQRMHAPNLVTIFEFGRHGRDLGGPAAGGRGAEDLPEGRGRLRHL
jgi:acyl CoA:acetate/3-ketoacid CoA transferase beta subunit